MRRSALTVAIIAIFIGCGGETLSEQAEVPGMARDVVTAVKQAADASDGEPATLKVGDLEATFGEEVPPGFPLALLQGTVIETGQRMDLPGSVIFNLHYTVADADPEEVAAFYEKALESKGLEVSRQSSENLAFPGQKIINLKVQSDDVLMTSMIATDRDGGTAGTLMWKETS